MTFRLLADGIWFVFLLGMLTYFLRQKNKLLKLKKWPKVKGRIINLQWEEENNRIWPQLVYQYQVEEKIYQGELLFEETLPRDTNSRLARAIAHRAVLAYQNHQEIDVFYNPNNPEDSVLDITVPLKLSIIIWLLWFLIGLHVVVVWTRWFHS